MALTYGFYNALDHDRRYDAVEVSSIFDGIIEDGVYQSIGTAMMVTKNDGMMLKIGIGRAWFDHSWTYNDSEKPIEIPQSELVLNRIDTIVLDIDSREEKRINSIIVIKGNPATNPGPKPLVKNVKHKQYPLARVYVKAGVTEIRQENITNCVGTSECPFVICPLKSINIDALVAKWQSQFDTWFENLEYVLSGDVAGKLYVEITKTNKNLNAVNSSIGGLQTAISGLQTSVGGLQTSVGGLQLDLGGCKLKQIGADFYIIGADSVTKKLGEPKLTFIGNFGGYVPAALKEMNYSDIDIYIDPQLPSTDISKYVLTVNEIKSGNTGKDNWGCDINPHLEIIDERTIRVKQAGGIRANLSEDPNIQPPIVYSSGWARCSGTVYYVGV